VLHVVRRLYGPDVSPVVTSLAAASILLIVGILRTFNLDYAGRMVSWKFTLEA